MHTGTHIGTHARKHAHAQTIIFLKKHLLLLTQLHYMVILMIHSGDTSHFTHVAPSISLMFHLTLHACCTSHFNCNLNTGGVFWSKDLH